MDGIIIRSLFHLNALPHMPRTKPIEIIELSSADLEGLKLRLTSNQLLEKDKSALLAIISAYAWIQVKLQSAKISIYRLRKMFGFKTEKRNRTSERKENTELELDLNTLRTLDKPDGTLTLQTTAVETSTKK
jgi:hypothetical protein